MTFTTYMLRCANGQYYVGSEKQLKGWSRAKKEVLIAGDYNTLHKLSSNY